MYVLLDLHVSATFLLVCMYVRNSMKEYSISLFVKGNVLHVCTCRAVVKVYQATDLEFIYKEGKRAATNHLEKGL